jgi:LuxR family maltose regulon positive regulatory protein
LCADWGSLGEIALEGYVVLAEVAQARGDVDGALALLRQAEAAGRAGRIAWTGARIGAAEIELRLRAAAVDTVGASRWAAGREEALRATIGVDYVGTAERLALGRMRLAQGRYDEALRGTAKLLFAAEVSDWTRAVIQLLGLRAQALHGMGRPADALVALSRALSLAEPEGYIRLFVAEGGPMIMLLRKAQRRGVASAYVEALLAACGEDTVSPMPPALVDPLSARELELLRLLAAGLSTPEIATRLVITAGTVRNHLKNIYGKLAVHGRLQAVERARALRLL